MDLALFRIARIATCILSIEILVCVLGCLGNISSLLVLIRHRNDIPASRILVGLTAADTGVLLSLIANSIVGIMGFHDVFPTYYARLMPLRHTEDFYEFFYICSIYMTVAVSADRYIVTNRPLMVRRLNHKALQWCVLFVVSILSAAMVLPNIAWRYVEIEICRHHLITPDGPYVHKSLTDDLCQYIGIAKQSETAYLHGNTTDNLCPACYTRGVNVINIEHFFQNPPCASDQCATPDEFRILAPLLSVYCGNAKQKPYAVAGTTGNWTLIERGHLDRCYYYNITGNGQQWHINVLQVPSNYPFSETNEFGRAYALGVVFPFRYVIPVLCLIFTSVNLLRAVRKSTTNQRVLAAHSAEERRILASSSMLKIVLTVTVVFILCHTLGLGCYLSIILYSFNVGTGMNYVIGLLCPVGGLATAINSSINVIVYCFFLRQFRDKWIKLWKTSPTCTSATVDGLPMSSLVTRRV